MSIPKDLIDKIREIMAKGEYRNISELILTSLENQVTLEEGEKTDEDLFSTTVRVPKSVQVEDFEKYDDSREFSNWTTLKSDITIPTLPMPTKKDVEYENYEESWFWGQINRIFPVKVGLRILANMQSQKGGFIYYRDFHEEVSNIARNLGLFLHKIDNQLKRKRDDRVSTGLPIGEKEEKSKWRYQAHFLANRRIDNILDGAMVRLKFVNINVLNDKEYEVGHTNEGLEFTKKKNLILDDNLNLERTLSDDEINFYLEHIRVNVPEELNPISHILRIINDGVSSVTEIDKEIRKIKPDWKDSIYTTNRSGALGRMNELRLLKKTKKGIRVIYELSDRGLNFLDRVKNG